MNTQPQMPISPESSTPLRDIGPIVESWGVPIRTKDEIADFIEAPLVEAAQILFEKGVATISSSANKKDLQRGFVYLGIDFDSLSVENQEIVRQHSAETTVTGKHDIFFYMDRRPSQTTWYLDLERGKSDEHIQNVLTLAIPVNDESTFGMINSEAVRLANIFKDQR